MKSGAVVATLAAGLLVFAACGNSGPGEASSSSQEKTPMSTPPSASRPPAPNVAPIEHNGVRYVQDTHDDRQGDQPGGYLAALDVKTGKRLWRLKVYDVVDSRAAGVQLGGVYFRAMRLAAGGTALEIENESGGVYRVDLATRKVTRVSAPPAAAPAAPAKPKPE